MNDKKQELKKLVELFEYNIKQYKGRHYDEAKVRADFIDKFFLHLGWDMYNNKGYSEQYREVIREDRVEIKGRVKAPDYCFRLGGVERKFFVEAKKPAVDIKHDVAPAFQLRRYAYTAKLPLSILTDFEEFAVYDTRIKPHKNDKASTARIFYCTYREYEKEYDFIYNTFSEEGIRKGSFDKYIEDTKRKKGTSEVDKEFLKLIESWRENLAKNIALRNKDLSIYELNYAVQKIIDRIIFLRIAEDREIEAYARLQKLTADKTAIYPRLVEIFTQADYKYNSGIFNFKEDRITPGLEIDDKVLKEIINSVYYPDSPYEFSVFDVEILGNIYEQFLGKTIRLTPAHQAKVEDKPEVKKAGGVYYTPKYIVDYIVKNTVEEKIKDKPPDEIAALKILDPACGSGSFLLGAYQLLLDYHLHYYTGDGNGSGKKQQGILKKALKENRVYPLREQEYRLTIEEKQRILLNNIFGVDIDSQAVEVTKLSLLLKLLEGESRESTGLLFKFSDIKLLPDLSANIKCGNSLIGSDFYDTGQLSLFQDEETVRRINVFDWEKEFAPIFAQGGFDIFIGNPPWGAFLGNDELEYIKKMNSDIIVRIIDSYMFFLNLGFKIVKKDGLIGQILPDVLLYQNDNLKIRKKLINKTFLMSIINFGNGVFENVNRPCCVLTFKLTPEINGKIKVCDKSKDKEKKDLKFKNFSQAFYLGLPNIIFITSGNIDKYHLLKKLDNTNFKELGYFTDKDGIQRGVSPDLKEAFIVNEEIIDKYSLEKNKIKKTITGGKHLKRYFLNWRGDFIIYTTRGEKPNEIRNIINFITKYKSKITCKEVKLKKHPLFSLHRPREERIFLKEEKIIGVITSDRIIVSIDKEKLYPTDGIYLFSSNRYYSNEFIVGILNSELSVFIYRLLTLEQGRVLAQVKPTIINKLPIPMLNLKNEVEKLSHDKMTNMVKSMLELQKKFHGAKLKSEKNMFKKQIDYLDNQIDRLVYQLYGLTDDEIKIVEGEE